MYYSKEKHQVVFVTGDTGGGEFDTYEYTDGELKKIESLVWHNGKFEEEGYILDGEKYRWKRAITILKIYEKNISR